MNKKILFGSIAIIGIGIGAYFYNDAKAKAIEKILKLSLDERVKTGDIISYASLTCNSKNDITCSIGELVSPMGSQTPEKRISFESIEISHVKDFMHFADENISLSNAEALELAINLHNIQIDNHPLFFDKPYLDELFKDDAESYNYIEKNFNQESSLTSSIKLSKKDNLLHVNDTAHFSIGDFTFNESAHILSKATLSELRNSNEENSMALMSKLVIEELTFDIKNPKGFLLNFYYISYKIALSNASSTEEKVALNAGFNIDSDIVVSKETFIKLQQNHMLASLDDALQANPSLAKSVNKNNQLRKKLQSIVAMESDSIALKITNSDKKSLADFSSIMMAYMLTQSFGNSLAVDVNIK